MRARSLACVLASSVVGFVGSATPCMADRIPPDHARVIAWQDDEHDVLTLQTSMRLLVDDRGHEVILAAMCHQAEQSFYKTVVTCLRDCQLVLDEVGTSDLAVEEMHDDLVLLRSQSDAFCALCRIEPQDRAMADLVDERWVPCDVPSPQLDAKFREHVRQRPILADADRRKIRSLEARAREPVELSTAMDNRWHALRHMTMDVRDPLDDLAPIQAERDAFVLSAVDHHLAQGRRRLAVAYGFEHMPAFEKGLRQRGFRLAAEWWVDVVSAYHPRGEPSQARLLTCARHAVVLSVPVVERVRQTACTTFAHENGTEVVLVGQSHFGEAEYFDGPRHLLRGQQIVLHEAGTSLAPPETLHPEIVWMRRYVRAQARLAALTYAPAGPVGAPWVPCDLDPTWANAVATELVSRQQFFLRPRVAEETLALEARAASPAPHEEVVAREKAHRLAKLREPLLAPRADSSHPMSVLQARRDSHVLATLEAHLREGRSRIGLVYGCHHSEVQHTWLEQRGFRPVSTIWLDAFGAEDGDARAAGVAPAASGK